MNSNVISITNLVRRFGKTTAVNSLSLDVPEGSVTGLLGPNGAGKSTSIHVMMGLLRRHGGDVKVLEYDPACDAVEIRKRTGFVPEDPRPEPRFKVNQQLAFWRAFRPGWDNALEKRLLKQFELDPLKHAHALSRGQRAKLALIGALAFKPELLILDDPTSGLDPLARREFMEGIVKTLAEEGKTVFMSTHQVDDIERLADRVIMIHNGTRIFSDTLESIHARWRRFRISLNRNSVPETNEFPGARKVEIEDRSAVVTYDRFSEEVMGSLNAYEGRTEEIPFALEDIYIELVRPGKGGTK